MLDLDDRILMAVPKKGRLKDTTLSYLKRVGISFYQRDRFDIALCSATPLALIFLPAKDIPLYVSDGRVSFGVTGQDMVAEHQSDVDEVLELGFGKCRLCLAGPKAGKVVRGQWEGIQVATSFPHLTTLYFRDRLKVKKFFIKEISGSVEITPTLGTADAVVDLVESGSTLREAGLEIWETIMDTQAVLIGRKNLAGTEKQWLDKIRERFVGVLTAEKHLIIDYNVHKDNLAQAEKLTPGMTAPTIMSLEQKDWFAVRSVILRGQMYAIIEELKQIGAEAILVTHMEYFQR